jgi:hypothetical protein
MQSFELLNFVNSIESLIFTLLFIIIFIGIGLNFFKNCFGKTITVKAKIIDKLATTYKTTSLNPNSSTVTDYVIVFYAKGKSIRFKTSVWLYDSVKKGQIGILKYKGIRLISFE